MLSLSTFYLTFLQSLKRDCCLNKMHEEGHFNPLSLLFPYSQQGDSITENSESWNWLEEEGMGSARSGLCYYKCKSKQNLEVKKRL